MSPTASDDEVLEQIWSRLQRIDEEVDRLRSLQEKREERFDRLHAELERYRNQHYERLRDPLFRSLIQHFDSVSKLVATWEQRPPEDCEPGRLLGVLRGFREDVEILLHQHGAESFVSARESFDGARQTAARTVATEDAARAGTVAARLRPGFEIGDRLLAKERVAVFVKSSPEAVRPVNESESLDCETERAHDGARNGDARDE